MNKTKQEIMIEQMKEDLLKLQSLKAIRLDCEDDNKHDKIGLMLNGGVMALRTLYTQWLKHYGVDVSKEVHKWNNSEVIIKSKK